MTNSPAPHANRVAVVTGASSGIGEAAARRLAASGAAVALVARRADRLETLAKEIERDGGTALVLAADVADAEAMRAAAAEVEAKLGRADLLFNNAGVMLAAPIDELATGDWQRMIDVNMTGLMNAIGAFVPQLVASAAEKGVADLVNTSSIGAQAVFPSFAVYVASKAYVTHLSKNLRADLGPKGVRVAAIEPGLVETELQGHVTDAGALEWLDGVRETLTWLKPEDVAETVAFLTSLPARVNLQQVTVMPTAQV
ncbi:SDR family oxidoreductase [Amycolatopsis keratiniphila]|uniref:SDR family oxidoreductase n=1 Tax=Amycolatopsis keratiniphila TaxID=129921 RepID=UPI00087BCF91|nr:SDR family oxidoreductase [Amycolatopsis keratiniphila]OLZ51919.1 short-chain dehydrogenase [Amycolatopsis keratiniphila subsp. nogabecina]SDU62026.1 NADP-dependent 3-hydroxy acid dehydrogenase YdfG [Amycolatopsis keratiniphila]